MAFGGVESSNGKKEVFDSEAAAALVKELKGNFNAGKTRSYEWRVSQLKAVIQLTVDHEKDIIDALISDLAKPVQESFLLEIVGLRDSCEFMLQRLGHWMAPEKVETSMTMFPTLSEIVPEPLGVVLVISAWNYPFALSLDPIIGAIAAGNAVVLKPSEIAPASSSLLAKLVSQYLDFSAIRVVEGAVPETTALLEQKWDKIFYTEMKFESPVTNYVNLKEECVLYETKQCYANPPIEGNPSMNQAGNGTVGRIVLAAAAKNLTPVTLELGGKCPVFVDSDIDLEVATRRLIAGKWGLNNGQTCVCADHLITTKDFSQKLIEAIKVELEKFFGKNPLQSQDISRIVSAGHFDRLEKLLDDDKISGRVVHGGQRDKNSLRISPTIILDPAGDSLVMKEEIFGPLLPIITVDNLDDGFNAMSSKEKPLAAYLFTNNKKLEELFVKTVSAGGLLINDIALQTLNDHLPFGGVGESGMGAYHGKFSFDNFSHKKAVMSRGFDGESPARYPPYATGKL